MASDLKTKLTTQKNRSHHLRKAPSQQIELYQPIHCNNNLTSRNVQYKIQKCKKVKSKDLLVFNAIS